jgi:hypothetical protein
MKQMEAQNAHGIKVGDLFYESWGWEQTNINFYQVVALKGKTTAIIREIARDYIGGYGWSGDVRPVRNSFIGEPVAVRSRLCDYYNPPRPQLGNTRGWKNHHMDPTTDTETHAYSTYA